jgi:tetratricopeptide (TPR) repeat protein
MCHWELHAEGETTELTFEAFKTKALELIGQEGIDDAFAWDRIGHWAQRDNDWVEAEAAYRRVYEIEPKQYGYYLGRALNVLDRRAEALPILLAQAEKYQPRLTVHVDNYFARWMWQ